ncbi:glucosamine-6-phosphate deaminase [Bacillus spongiae]|uniref:Glucosamine-6-phosphate deaminase n=1 Tax=Bacillus spongiae TaxID=2683610 RepID=A0ABU8HAP3_9BACI
MRILETKNYQEMSQLAAEYIIEKIRHSAQINLGLATGSTPLGTYSEMIKDFEKDETSYQHVRTFNLDEYVGLDNKHPNSYNYFMRENLFNHINITEEQTHIPNGMAANIEKVCQGYEELLEKQGGIDLQLLGIGKNGHIGFNEPGTSFESITHKVKLAQSTRLANARFFTSMDKVPTHAITMGISTILRSKEILLLVSGEEKSEAVKQLFYGPINENFPASVLNTHQNVTIIGDKKAFAGII